MPTGRGTCRRSASLHWTQKMRTMLMVRTATVVAMTSLLFFLATNVFVFFFAFTAVQRHVIRVRVRGYPSISSAPFVGRMLCATYDTNSRTTRYEYFVVSLIHRYLVNALYLFLVMRFIPRHVPKPIPSRVHYYDSSSYAAADLRSFACVHLRVAYEYCCCLYSYG